MTMMEELQKKRTREEMLEDFIAYDYLKSHKDCNGQVGVVVLFWRLDCQYDGGKSSYSISSSALLWRTAHCSRSRTNNNTATALRRFRQPVNEGWPAYEAILRKNNIENTAFIILESIMVFITIQHQGTMKLQLQYHGVEQSIFLKNN
jgi:carboxymethylenebutenolidase